MKIALGIQYHGQDYHGWQAQDGLLTVQGCLEKALTQIADEPIQVFCAGRTDAGVHALDQVIHFETNVQRVAHAWTLGANAYLPPSISVSWMREVDMEFHARFSALARRYCYVIYNYRLRSAISAAQATWHYRKLNADTMHEAGQFLVGEHDFSSFRASSCEAKTPVRCVQELSVKRHGDFVTIEIQANAFLHHMVRNIVGVLMLVGSGARPVDWVADVLSSKDRRLAGATAPAQGLYLNRVIYPERYQLPTTQNTLLFL